MLYGKLDGHPIRQDLFRNRYSSLFLNIYVNVNWWVPDFVTQLFPIEKITCGIYTPSFITTGSK